MEQEQQELDLVVRDLAELRKRISLCNKAITQFGVAIDGEQKTIDTYRAFLNGDEEHPYNPSKLKDGIEKARVNIQLFDRQIVVEESSMKTINTWKAVRVSV